VLAALLSVFAFRSQSRKRRLEQLKSLHSAKDEFITSISHELRTPLSAVLGMAAELRDHLSAFSSAEIEELVTIIAEQSEEVSLIVEDLLVSARLDDGNLAVIAEPIELHRQVENAVVPFRAMMPAVCEVIGEATAYGDGGRVRQILRNLIGNAVRHGGDRVVVRIEPYDGAVRLVVKDNGPGLPPSEWESVFDAYHRAGTFPVFSPPSAWD
jgi:signal transduction histidine kinase